MSEPIKVGDLVMVVRGRYCCGHETGHEGSIFTVTRFYTPNPRFEKCKFCDRPDVEMGAYGLPQRMSIDVYRLKRIPPLSELDDVKRDEEITA